MKTQAVGDKFEQLVAIMARLRSSEGCIWDRQQTHASLRQYLLEETYEVLEAIDHKDHGELAKELGDLLLQVVFHAQIAAGDGHFDIGKVIENISGKMIRRHPHVFGDEKVTSVEQQKLRWEEIKKNEGKKSVIDGVPAALPALQRAARLQQKANEPPPTWDRIDSAYHRFKALLQSAEQELEEEGPDRRFEVIGELLFALVGISRTVAVNPEDALREACEQFQSAFSSGEHPQL